MKIYFIFIGIIVFSLGFAQERILKNIQPPLDIKDFLVDDYGNFYFYRKNNFSFTKQDSLGNTLGLWMQTFPFKIQQIQNPLNIVLFSENKQELRFLDQKLNEIQKFSLTALGYINMAYTENLQQIWLLDQSEKRILNYQFRDKRILKSIPIFYDLEEVIDMIIFQNKLYLLQKNELLIIDIDTLKSIKLETKNARKLKRENEQILVLTNNSIYELTGLNSLKIKFTISDLDFVDKNSEFIYGIKKGKLYLYTIQK